MTSHREGSQAGPGLSAFRSLGRMLALGACAALPCAAFTTAAASPDPARIESPARNDTARSGAPQAGPARAAAAPAAPGRSDSARVDMAGDSAAAPDTAARKLYTYISYPFLQMATLPVEVLLVPAVRLVLIPTKPPLRYLLNENVIDRTIKLISFGEDDRIMLYPTMNLAPGTGSSTGLTLRDQALFGRASERAVLQSNFYVNGDWKMRTYATAADMFGTGFNSKLSLTLFRVKNASFNVPGTSGFWSYADTSNTVAASVSRLVYEKFALRGQYSFRDSHFGQSPTANTLAAPEFLLDKDGKVNETMRGLQSNWHDQTLLAGVMRDTRNNQNIVLEGSDLEAIWHYHFTDAHHDYHAWEASLSNYFKLGSEKYEITPEEERKAGGLSMQKVLKKMELENLRKELFNRKVLVTHFYAAQSYEVPGNHMPVYGLQTLGNDTPMRGYSGSRFRDYTVLSAGAEYRFPILRLVDGVIFDEYGWTGRSWDKIEYWGGLKNSWGFGIRARRPDIYLFRCQLGFHGTQGIVLNLSVDEPY